jgi:predicted RNase H-like HicB family nuclease
MTQQYLVRAEWDSEALVWVASSDDVPGLATEADTIEALEAKLQTMVPEFLALNGHLPSGGDCIQFEVLAHRVSVCNPPGAHEWQ